MTITCEHTGGNVLTWIVMPMPGLVVASSTEATGIAIGEDIEVYL